MCERTITVAGLSSSQRSRVGVEIKRSATGEVKRFERFYGLNTAMYKNASLDFTD